MRQLLVEVPQGKGDTVLEIAEKCKAVNVAQFDAKNQTERLDAVFLHVSNHRVEDLLNNLQEAISEVRVTLVPRGVLALQPPASEAPEQVTNVEKLSAIEVFLAGLQSVGTWTGFLGYAAVSGIVVWIGLFTSSTLLLVAAALLAPFASPAMTAALASARGDLTLLRRSVQRYFGALSTAIVVAWLLSLATGQQIATSMMVNVSELSSVSVLLPLVAGAAGALNLSQSERNSLVSSAATGVVVAAAIAPPAGVVGMASALGRWDLAGDALFILLLQLIGINLTGTLLFRFYTGIAAKDSYYSRGKQWVIVAASVVTVVLLAGFLYWQFSDPPELLRSSRAQRAAAEARQVVDESNLARTVEVNLRFTRPQIEGQNTLLGIIYVQRAEQATQPTEEIRTQLTNAIQQQLQEEFNVTPLIDVNVLEPPAGEGP